MRIIQQLDDISGDLIAIESAIYIGNFAIRITFSDGHQTLVDFKPFLNKSGHPSIKKYLNEMLFRQFEIIEGNLNWNDYDMIFPLEDIYKGNI